MLHYPSFSPRQRIGLYGGSFNPAHDGHLAVADAALSKLGLHKVWWLVSPQNRLKSRDDTADFAERLRETRKLVAHPQMEVTDIEQQAGVKCTADTLEAMQAVLKRGRFVWIMGADCFAELHRWHRWHKVINSIPICVFDRPGYGPVRTLSCPAALYYSSARIQACNASLLPDRCAPAWSFITWPVRSESSTAIRSNS